MYLTDEGYPCAERDFSDGAVVEARGDVHGEVSHQHSFSLEKILSAADGEGQSVQEHLSHFQKILTDLLSVGENVEEKTRMLILLASLFPSYESLVTALLVGKSTIKMDRSPRRYSRTRFLGEKIQLQAQMAVAQLWWRLEEQEAIDGVTGDRDEGGPSLGGT